ncbi:MAG: hypothetical protein CBB87_10410 [Micavibrio sp. TMED27]|nr:hypothetical protein [Micavibrio sp.]OUT90167.1 MAG: hypothetical protein CBB87_10410 [Micavibrio sp. TMED27]|tara:strand:- start:799 stop:1014 length:216 start_codon:yes stop_codon:yes gene_type:complete
MSVISAEEVSRLQGYLEAKFKNTGFALKMREKAKDSVEVLLNGEFIGVIYKDDEENDISFDFNMAILEEDL